MKNQKKHLFQENITRFFMMFQWSKIILLSLIAFSIIINQFSPVVYAHAETTSSITSESTQSTPLISSESASMSSTTSDIQGVDYATTTDEDYSLENIKIIEEDRSLRTETTKTFLKEDGSYALAIYGEAIHYEEDGVFKDIDNTLYYEKETDSYQNTANRLQLKFPKNLDHHAKVQLSVDDYDVAWSVQGIQQSSFTQEAGTKAEEDIRTLNKVSQKVTYQEVQPGVDLEYLLLGNQVKENIILNHYIPHYQIRFQYELKGLTITLDENGEYQLINQEGRNILSFDPLIMSDAKEEQSNAIHWEMMSEENNQYLVTITPDDHWLQQATYPVMIDPSLKSSTTTMSIQDTYVSSAAPTTNFSTSTTLPLSDYGGMITTEGLIHFAMPDLSGKKITYSYLTLTKQSGTTNSMVGLYKNTSTFTPTTVTWNNKPSLGAMIDYQVLKQENNYRFNITAATMEWLSTGVVTGFTIRNQASEIQNTFYSMEYSIPSYRPLIEIGYLDAAGLKDYWTYRSQPTGAAGTGYVSDFTGTMNVVRNDIQFTTDKQALSLDFAYNILNKDSNVGYGKGWNISYNTKLISTPTLYTVDYTGNKVYYQPTTCDSRLSANLCYLAEDGSRNRLGIMLIQGTVTNQVILTADNIKMEFGNDQYLDKITDITKNLSLTISRNSSNKDKVTSIIDSSGNSITLTYGYSPNPNVVATLSIKQPNGTMRQLETTKYYFNSVSRLTRVEHFQRYDNNASMVINSNQTAYYSYDSYSRLYQSYLSNAEKTEYSYVSSTDHRVSRVRSYFNNNLFSDIDYTYTLKSTTITDQNDDFIIYKFDDFGHSVNLIDNHGNVQCYQYINIFNGNHPSDPVYTLGDGTPNYNNNHRLVTQSSPQSNVFNPINNHGFEGDDIREQAGWNLVIGNMAPVTGYERSSTEVMFGNYSAMLDTSFEDNMHLEQTIILDAGVYTLVGYAKNESSSSSGVYFDVVGESYGGVSEEVTNDGIWVKKTMTFGITNDNTSINVLLVNHSNEGRAYFDNIQIVEGFTDTRINYMDNPSFEIADSSGTMADWTYSSSSNVQRANIESTLDPLYQSMLGDYALIMMGDGINTHWAHTGLSEFFDACQYYNGSLQIGGWAKSSGIPSEVFRLRIDLVFPYVAINSPSYNDSILRQYYIDFDTNIEGWQYQYGKIDVSLGERYYVNLFLEYQGMGNAYFDGIQLFHDHSSTSYQYNQAGNNTSISTSSGSVTTKEYGDVNNPYAPTEIDVNGKTVTMDHSSTTHLINTIGANNVTSTPTYNSYGQVTQLKVGEGSYYFTTSTSYTHLSQYVSTTTNEFGKTTNYYYDTYTGLLQAIENAKGQDTHYIYDNEGKLIEVKSVKDYTNPSSVVDASVEYEYDSMDRLWKIKMSDTYYYVINYDSAGRMQSVLVNSQALMTYSYEMDGSFYTGRLDYQTYGNGDILSFDYDNQERITKIQFKGSGSSTPMDRFSYEYDQSGNIAIYHTHDDNGVIMKSEYYTYDSSGNLIQSVDQAGNKVLYTYDVSGTLTGLSFQVNNHSFSTQYLPNECLSNGTEPCSISGLYDQTRLSLIGGTSVTKDYVYETNALRRLDFIRLSIGTFAIKQDFTFSGNTTRISSITYDIGENGSIEYQYRYLYDALGNIIEVKYYEGTTLKTTDYYDYDGLNQVVVEDHQQSTASYTKVYQYDTHGNRTAVHQYAYEGRPTISIPTSYYTNTGNMPVVPYYNGSSWSTFCFIEVGGSIPSFSFEYYEEEYWFSIPATTSLVSLHYDAFHKGYYEAVYRAVNVQYGVDVTFNIRIGVGHLFVATPQIQSQYQYNSPWLDQLSSYDILGTTHTITYDSQGNPTTITNFAYKGVNYHHANLSWDGRALRTIEVYNASDVLVATISYRYNDQGYRTEKDIYEVATNTTQTITYTLSGDKVLDESDGTYQLVYTYDYDGTIIRFYYDANSGDSVSGADYFYLRNQQGDITAIIDNGGNILVKYRYDAYGNILGLVDNSIGDIISAMNPYTYRGYRYDSEIGYYYLNSRYYNPETGRFINADGMLGEMGDIPSTNMYAYCANNPVMYVDPSGEFIITLSIVLWAAAIGATSGGIIGSIYGGFTAAANGQNIWAGIGIGVISGAIMGAGAGVGAIFLSPVLAGTSISVGTTLLSMGSALSIGSGIAFGSGAVAGALSDAGSQYFNNQRVHDWGSVGESALEWGIINTANSFSCAYLESLTSASAGLFSRMENSLVSSISNFVYGSYGLFIDAMRGRNK